jgi:uncharacterized protein YkwD
MSVSQNTKQSILAFGVAIVIALVVGFFTLSYVVFETFNQPAQPVQAQTALNPDEVFALVNQERIKQGLRPLQRDARLDATAQMKLNQLVADNSIEHIDKNGKHGYQYIKDQNPGWCHYLNENISKGYQTANGVVSGWMGSRVHHDEILNSNYTLSGIAINGNLIVQHFCGPWR